MIASNEPSDQTRLSLESQTIAPSQIIIANKSFQDKNVGLRVAKAINAVMESVDPTKFDWFLRVDGDVILPPKWIEISINSGADVIGRGGYSLLVRMRAFKAVNYRFPIFEKEDSMLILKLQSLGFESIPYLVKPKFLREPGRGTDKELTTFFKSGIWTWKMGYEPIHAVYNSLNAARVRRNPRYLLGVFGYAFAALTWSKKWDPLVAKYVFRKQLRALVS